MGVGPGQARAKGPVEMANGFILWRGPSLIDGAPIVAIATGLDGKSTNAKTGALAQTWIMREDIPPTDAANNGADASVCGDCVHRGKIVDGKNVGRSCYVTLFQAPLWVWKCYRRGLYQEGDARALLAGKRVRLGAYGNPSAIPFAVWENALADAEAHTGYVHNWRDCDPRFARYVMASCDSEQERIEAKARGYRTFRVRAATEALGAREIVCPASHEAGQKTTCAQCVACGGHEAKAKVDVAIIVHGARAKQFRK